jgi:phosphotriesterase-related protein
LAISGQESRKVTADPVERCAPQRRGPSSRAVETVLGPVEAADLGVVLIHEHVLADWIGAEMTSPDRYDHDDVVSVVLPHLTRARELGVRTIAECTPAFLGRDVRLLERLARESGLHVLTNTGIYGAADDKFVPAGAFGASAASLADGWIREREDGINGTEIRPAFMKIGVDAGPLSDIDAKLVQAAAAAHQVTGLAIHSHTGDAEAGLAQLALLDSLGASLEAFVWVHAQNVDDLEILAGAAARGAWIELDGVAPDTITQHADLLLGLAERGHLGRLLVSHDAGWYSVGETGGAPELFRGYDTVFTSLIPELLSRGTRQDDIDTLLIANPRSVLTGH